jgi:hypothetical protein
VIVSSFENYGTEKKVSFYTVLPFNPEIRRANEENIFLVGLLTMHNFRIIKKRR